MTNPRTKARIEARIRERAAHCVEFELNDPRAAFITITGVEVSTDLSVAKILYSVYGGEADRSRATHMLEDASGFVRKQVGRVLKTRRVPRLVWIYDDSVEYQEKMEATIREAIRQDREINPGAHEDVVYESAEEDQDSAVEREYLEFLNADEEELE
jgi:ribosome-binding factor A